MLTTSNDWITAELTRRRHQELLKQAEQYRLLRQASEDLPSENRGLQLRTRVVIWLGNHFVDWGNTILAWNSRETVCEQGC